MYCRTCGSKLNDNAELCVKCGVRRNVGNNFCQVCGARTTEAMKNCPKCDALLKTAFSSAQMKQMASDKVSNGKKVLKKFLVIFGWIVIAGDILLILFGGGGVVLGAIGAACVFAGRVIK